MLFTAIGKRHANRFNTQPWRYLQRIIEQANLVTDVTSKRIRI
ncbi:hypothetical protein D030_2046A, partial [Vibrio parahaemolyticus AQ3810]